MPEGTIVTEKARGPEISGELPKIAGLGFVKPSLLAEEILQNFAAGKPEESRAKAFEPLSDYLGVLSREGRHGAEVELFASEVLSRVVIELLKRSNERSLAEIIERAPKSPADIRDMLLAVAIGDKLDGKFPDHGRAIVLSILDRKDIEVVNIYEFPRTVEALKSKADFFDQHRSEIPGRMWLKFDELTRFAHLPELLSIQRELFSQSTLSPEKVLTVVELARTEPGLLRGSFLAYQLELTEQVVGQIAKLPEVLFQSAEFAPIIRLAKIFDRPEISRGEFIHEIRSRFSTDEEVGSLNADQLLASGLSPLMQAQVLESLDTEATSRILLEIGTLEPTGPELQLEILNLIAQRDYDHYWDVSEVGESASTSQLEQMGKTLAQSGSIRLGDIASVLYSYLDVDNTEKTVPLMKGYLSAIPEDEVDPSQIYNESQNGDFSSDSRAVVFALALMDLEATPKRATLLPMIMRDIEWQDTPRFQGAPTDEKIVAELLRKYAGHAEIISSTIDLLESASMTLPLLVTLAADSENVESLGVFKSIVENLKEPVATGLSSEDDERFSDDHIVKAALQTMGYGTLLQKANVLNALFSERSHLHSLIDQFLNEYSGGIKELRGIVAAWGPNSGEAALTIVTVLRERGRTEDAKQILDQVIENGHGDERVLDAIREISPERYEDFVAKNWGIHGDVVLDSLARGDVQAIHLNVLAKEFGISTQGIEAIISHAPRSFRGQLDDIARQKFFRAVLADSTVSDKDRVLFAHAAVMALTNWSFIGEVQIAAQSGILRYSASSSNAWQRYLDRLNLVDASTTILSLDGFPKQRAANAMLHLLTNVDQSPVLEGLVARGGDTFFIPVWRQVIARMGPGDVKEVLDALSRVENLPPQIARAQYDEIRSRRLASDSLLAKSSLIMANVEQTEEVRRAWLRGTQAEQQLTQLREQVRSVGLPTSIDPERLVPHQPAPVETITRIFLLQASTPAGVKQLASAIEKKGFGDQVNNLLVSAANPNRFSDEFIDGLAREAILMATRNQINVRLVKSSTEFKIWPIAQGPSRMPQVSPQIAKQTMAIIGGGPAALITARFREEMGYLPNSTTIFSQAPVLGGIWRQRNVVDEGHNTFRAAELFGARLDAREPRPGSELVTFLDRLATDDIKSQLHQGEVTRVLFRKEDQKYAVFVKNGKDEVEVGLYDSVLVCTGNRKARALNSTVMRTNIDSIERAPLERWQREIRPDEYSDLAGTSPTLIGLGNSTMAMIGEFMKMKTAGFPVNPRILTHLSLDLLQEPGKVIETGAGEIQGPLYRNPSGLNRIAGDIERIQGRLRYALEQGWIIPDVTSWHVTDHRKDVTRDLSISVSTKFGQVAIDRVPRIFGLIGYQNDPEMLTRFGCKCDPKTGEVRFDARTGRVIERANAGNRMYVAGTAATSRTDRNQEVIPGMLRSIPLIMFSELLAGEE